MTDYRSAATKENRADSAFSAARRDLSASGLPPRAAGGGSDAAIALDWLLRLRWWVIVCQVLLVLVILALFQVAVPLPLLGLIIGFGAASNLYFHLLVRRRGKVGEGSARGVGEGAVMVAMCLDVLLFSALLYVTGGPMNPFTFLYLIHIALGAILLRPAWAAGLAGLASVAYAALFMLPAYAPSRELGLLSLATVFAPCHAGTDQILLFGREISPHLQGMWVAFAITAFFIVFFVGRVYKALEYHRQTLHQLREEQRKTEKLASLATLAAGAAHELATPLATIAVASGEMRHLLKQYAPAGGNDSPHAWRYELVTDLELIREQVQRCRDILYQMGADAGSHLGEAEATFPVGEAVAQALESFPAAQRQLIVVDNPVAGHTVRLPRRTLVRTLRGLLKNALEASAASAVSAAPPVVEMHCTTEEHFLVFEVRDQGTGMDDATRQRAGEPFFTTKEAGLGMGLGLFLARTAAEHCGGDLQINSAPGRGTTVRLRLGLSSV